MKEYFLGLMIVSLFGATLIALSPSGYEKPLRLLCGLCAVGAIVLPLARWTAGGFEVKQEWLEIFEQGQDSKEYYDEIYNKSLLGAEGENAQQILKNEIIKEFSLQNDSFELKIVFDNKSEEICISHVELVIYPSGIQINPHSIEEYVSTRLGCECYTIYDF